MSHRSTGSLKALLHQYQFTDEKTSYNRKGYAEFPISETDFTNFKSGNSERRQLLCEVLKLNDEHPTGAEII